MKKVFLLLFLITNLCYAEKIVVEKKSRIVISKYVIVKSISTGIKNQVNIIFDENDTTKGIADAVLENLELLDVIVPQDLSVVNYRYIDGKFEKYNIAVSTK